MPINRQLATIGLVLVILFPMVVPATASWPGDSTRSADPTANVPVQETQAIAENDSPRALKGRAIGRLASMPSQGWFDQRFRKRAIRLLNGTVAEYRDGTRVSKASMFQDDQRALGLVAPLAWTNRSMAEEVARLVVQADLTTVNTSISDAKRARRLVQDRLEDRRARLRADRAIGRSIQARDKAIATLEKDRGPWRSVHRRRALLQLRIAWSHADRALDILARAVTPIIEIRTRNDPPGDKGIGNRTISGVVSHVRAYELGSVSVTVNGSRVATVPIDASIDPVENASFEVNLTVDRSIAVVGATVTRNNPERALEAGRHDRWGGFGRFPTRGSWSAHWDRHSRSAKEVSGSGTASVRFDGDGLPDMFETGWTHTDPLDPDSDARDTDTDEGNNGRPDGAEDFDGDGLLAYVENDLGTNPTTADSDNDGLPDRFEARLRTLLDPTDADTDGDGLADGREDFDGDRLPAEAEHENGTSIASADTDNDGLEDGAEVRLHLTNPLESDSDGDGLGDGEELRVGSDPLLADTDGNGVDDSGEVFTTQVTDQETGVEIEVLGGGDVASHVDIEAVPQPTNTSFLASPVVRVRNHSRLDTATVTLPITNSSLGHHSNLSVFTWSPGRDRHWRPLRTRIDGENGTVSADVGSFSYFTAMDEDRWRSAISDSISIGWPRHESFEDLDGWTRVGHVVAEDGRLIVAGRSNNDGTPDIVVAADGSGDFNRVQDGVYAAEPGDTLLVKAGVYPETVVVDRPLSIVGDGAVLNGKSLGEHAFHGIKIETERLSVRGFTIRNYHRNIDARETTADVDISETIFRRGGWGINAQGSVGDWALTDVEMIETFIDGIQADESRGDWTLRGVRANGSMESGISAQGAVGDWSLRDVEFSGHEDFGLRLNGTAGTWTIHEAVIASNGRHGIAATANDGTIAVNHSQIVRNGAAGVGATEGASEVDARSNWWGQADGPLPGQVSGNVDVSSACGTPTCGTSAREFREVTEFAGERITHTSSVRPQQPQTEGVSVGRRKLTLAGGVSAITITARWRGSDGGRDPPTLRVVSDNEEAVVASATSTSDAFATSSTDISRFAGRTVTLEAAASGAGQLEVDWVDVAIDTDGDGLRDAIERADLGMPTGPRPGASLSALDPTDPDTDGDGLEDGEELTDVIVRVDAADNPGGVSFQASEARSDPTEKNSDGGGLNDAEEVEVGSDPFVMETLVAGFTLPTMTDGSGSTYLDRNPMTVKEANGLLTGSGRDSSVIAWASRQFFDPVFCIKELTDGPGCAPEWMNGIEQQQDMQYVYVPFVVYAESNVEIGRLPYEMVFSGESATLVKGVNTSGRVGSGSSKDGYLVFELPEKRAYEEAQPRAFRSIGRIGLQINSSNTHFNRGPSEDVEGFYAMSTNTLLPATDQLLQDTKFVLEQGINIALAAETGVTIAVQTGSKATGALAFLFELIRGEVGSAPVTIEDMATETSMRGITSFEQRIKETENEIYTRIYGDGVVRPTGPTVIRQN